ncbi:MAG: hypothetical protein HOO67_08115 [Candidatus Peribacteraceae bacterium]|nr:hypothetical protein [Candidatus Peribacteraceae bacterium]
MEFPLQIGSMHVHVCRDRYPISSILTRPDVRWKVGKLFADSRQMSLEPTAHSLVHTDGPMSTIPDDPWMLLETEAIPCALVCAADDHSGAAVIDHKLIIDLDSLRRLDAFRDQVKHLLSTSHCVISGLNVCLQAEHTTQPNQAIAAAVKNHVADITHPTSVLADAEFRKSHGWTMITGMAFAPLQLTRDHGNHLFLLNKHAVESVSMIVPGKRRKQ